MKLKLLLFIIVNCLAGAWAGNLQVQVQDLGGKPLLHAVVYLESASARQMSKPSIGIEMAQVARQFEPRVLVVPVGTTVQFPNRDTVRHHVYSFSNAKNFEIKLYSGVPAAPVLFDKLGVAVLGCNIHDNMVGWVVVVDTPFFGRSQVNGVVLLTEIPNGIYRLRVWHPELPSSSAPYDQALVVDAAPASVAVRLNTAK